MSKHRMCKICVNTDANPSIKIGRDGLCQICAQYKKYFDKKKLKGELNLFSSMVGSGRGRYDIMAGISGGKDSSAMLYMLKKRGFRILAFSFDTGYYPKHIFTRAAHVAASLEVDYRRIDIRKYIRPSDLRSFQLMADLYEETSSPALEDKFRKLYKEGRNRYSVKYTRPFTFVRTCQLCRRLVIRAYYGEALKYRVPMVVLGINEWAHLSAHGGKREFSAIRKLMPYRSRPPVYIVHSPFLFQRKSEVTRQILSRMGWRAPKGEKLIESNANSCLLARAAESKACQMLGFHPDTTRLAREVTAGFITKKQAMTALVKKHYSRYTVRSILQNAEIL